MRLVFVCHANIARSPSAEVIARALAGSSSSWTFASAGVKALVGHPVDPTMSAALRHLGFDASAHRGAQASTRMLHGSHLILTFESAQRSWVLAQHPAAARSTFTIRRAARILADRPRHGEPLGFLAHDSQAYTPDDDFADPYGQGPEAAAHAVEQIADLLGVILPALGAVARPTRSAGDIAARAALDSALDPAVDRTGPAARDKVLVP